METHHEKTFALPKELSQRSSAKAAFGFLYSYFLFFGAWAGIGYLWGGELSWPIFVKLALTLTLLVLGGYGMLLMGFMGHDGTHFTLHSNKIVSSAIGVLVTAPVVPYMVMGFTISHWNHHKFTNGEQDPDAYVFSRFKTLFSRAFLARPYSFWEYGSNTVRLAFGIPLKFDYQFPLTKNEVQGLAIFNVVLTIAFAGVYFVLLILSPIHFLALISLYLFGTVISGLSPYVEHTGTDIGRGHDTRTAVGWWWDILILGNNYHIEHHLYPTVPFYNLKKVYRYLLANGYYDQQRFVSKGVWDTYRYALGKYPYPCVEKKTKPSQGV